MNAVTRDVAVDRVWSRIELKSVHEEERILEGFATTPDTDLIGDQVDPLGGVGRPCRTDHRLPPLTASATRAAKAPWSAGWPASLA